MVWSQELTETIYHEEFNKVVRTPDHALNAALMYDSLHDRSMQFNNDKVASAALDIFSEHHADIEAMQALEELGLVLCTSEANKANPFSSWEITQRGIEEMHPAMTLHDPVLVKKHVFT